MSTYVWLVGDWFTCSQGPYTGDTVRLHCSDTGEVTTMARDRLMVYPVFGGMDILEDVYIPGVTLADLDLIKTFPFLVPR